MRLSDLAEMLGYENQSAFSRVFKLAHDVSPKQWREAAKR
jgi:AraC-like DNA-binding protein